MSRRKDRVLNTRIPEQLDRELREQAARLDVSVSELVRDVLVRAVDLVGNLSGNVESLVADIVEDVEEIRKAGTPPRAARAAARREVERSVIGWQEITVARPARCAISGVELRPGAKAFLGVRADGRASVTISAEALQQLLAGPSVEWVSLVLQQPTPCALTGLTMGKGEAAWFDPQTQPPKLVCQAAYDRLRAGESEETIAAEFGGLDREDP